MARVIIEGTPPGNHVVSAVAFSLRQRSQEGLHPVILQKIMRLLLSGIYER
jgi:hypothetical protein